MNEAPLTQEEIQALIAGQLGGATGAGNVLDRLEQLLTAAYADVAAALQAKAGLAVTIGRPDVQERTQDQVGPELAAAAHVVFSMFAGSAAGQAAMSIDADAAARLGESVTMAALGDEVFAAVASRLSETLGDEVVAAPATALAPSADRDALAATGLGAEIVQAFTPLMVGDAPAGHWLLLLDRALVAGLAEQATAAADAAVAALPAAPAPEQEAAPVPAAAPAAVTSAATAPAPVAAPAPAAAVVGGGAPVSVQPAAFGDIGQGSSGGTVHNIDLLMDVPLQVTVELGRTRRPIKDILALGPGSIVELDRFAGEPVDVFVNGQLVARGEVVVIDENFGVRITDIVSPADRVRSL